jgi:hypothetical protein
MQAFTEKSNNWLFVRVHTDSGISGMHAKAVCSTKMRR